MQPLGEHFLANAGLALDQDGDVTRRDALEQPFGTRHRMRLVRRTGGRRRCGLGLAAHEDQHHRSEVDHLSRRQLRPLTGIERAVGDAGAVRAAEVLDPDLRPEGEERVLARDRGVIDADVGLGTAADHQVADAREREQIDEVLAHHPERQPFAVADTPRHRDGVGREVAAHEPH